MLLSDLASAADRVIHLPGAVAFIPTNDVAVTNRGSSAFEAGIDTMLVVDSHKRNADTGDHTICHEQRASSWSAI
jgi:hypothetical protein